jgi:hypothetical protein
VGVCGANACMSANMHVCVCMHGGAAGRSCTSSAVKGNLCTCVVRCSVAGYLIALQFQILSGLNVYPDAILELLCVNRDINMSHDGFTLILHEPTDRG